MAEIDFEAEGLLEGLEGDVRKSRLRLLTELADDGVPLDELRTAVAEDRLALLPVERVLGGGEERLTAAEVAERAPRCTPSSTSRRRSASAGSATAGSRMTASSRSAGCWG